jgi:hypothetical protein
MGNVNREMAKEKNQEEMLAIRNTNRNEEWIWWAGLFSRLHTVRKDSELVDVTVEISKSEKHTRTEYPRTENQLGNMCHSCNGKGRLSTVAHACNPSYLEGRDQEDHSLSLALGKKLARHHLNKSDMVVLFYYSSCTGDCR